MRIPFAKPTFEEEELDAIKKVINSGWTVLGPKTQEFEEEFAKYVGAKYAVFVDSGTSALFLAIRAMNYKDFISIPSLTFVSDAEVVYHAGLKINFVDVNKDSFCIDEQHDNLLPVNLYGNLAKGKGMVVDSCHRIERNDVKDSKSLWCYSFYTTKNMSCVHGGMIALNDEALYQWLLMARDHGLDKGTAQRYKGKNPIYDVKFAGWRVKGNDLMAVIGLEQLKKLPWITEQRNRVVARYNKNLGLSRTGNHIYPILVNDRIKFIEKMHEFNIQTSIHFIPINTFTAYKDDKKLPVTDYLSSRICSLPLFPQMTDEEIDYVSECILGTKLIIK